MTNFEASEPAFNAAAAALKAARVALLRSKSRKNIIAMAEATDAFEAALAACHEARWADEANEVAEQALAVAAETAAARAAEPTLF